MIATRWACWIAVVGFAIGLAGAACGQEEAAPSEAERAARLKEAEAHVNSLKLTLAQGDEEVKLIARPLLVYGDSARHNADGTLWAWGSAGRPLVFMETYRHTSNQENRVNAITLTGQAHVVLTIPAAQTWQPQKTQIDFRPLGGGAPPSSREAGRLRQMRELARRFTAHEFWDPDNSRFELRLLAQPVHRYSDARAGLLDGAAFVLANGTNPEIVLLIEALAERGRDAARWQYGLARLGSAELHVSLDDTEVWKLDRTPRVIGYPVDPYWIFFTKPIP